MFMDAAIIYMEVKCHIVSLQSLSIELTLVLYLYSVYYNNSNNNNGLAIFKKKKKKSQNNIIMKILLTIAEIRRFMLRKPNITLHTLLL